MWLNIIHLDLELQWTISSDLILAVIATKLETMEKAGAFVAESLKNH